MNFAIQDFCRTDRPSRHPSYILMPFCRSHHDPAPLPLRPRPSGRPGTGGDPLQEPDRALPSATDFCRRLPHPTR
ncbi:MAG: hypothetical protein WAW52_14175, partial [Methanothrix sp.]